MYLVLGGVPGPRGVYLVPGGCTWSRGVYLVRGGTWSRGDVPGPGGVYLVPGGCTWSQGGVPGPGGRGCTWSWGGVPGPGGCTWSQGGVPGPGVYLVPGGMYLVLGVVYLVPGGVYLVPGGVPGPGGVYLVPGGCTWSGTPPPVNRMTNRCKNITLAKTSFRPVIILNYRSLDHIPTNSLERYNPDFFHRTILSPSSDPWLKQVTFSFLRTFGPF